MDIKNIIASFTGSSKVNSNKSYTNKDSQSFLKILEQSSERTKFQKNFDKKIGLLQDEFSLDMTSIDNVKNLVKSVDVNVAGEDLSEPSLKDIVSSLEILISNNMNLTSKEISNVKEKLESKINSLADDFTIEIGSIDKLKSVLKGIDENLSTNKIKDINTNLANEILFNSKNNVNKSDDAISVKYSSNSGKELVQLLQEVKTKLNMDPTEKVSDNRLGNETLYNSLPGNGNYTEVKTEKVSDELTSEKLNKSIENMLSDKDISEPSLKDIVSSLEILIANNMNLTSKEISNVKEKLESKINSLADDLTIEMDFIDKLKSVLKGIDENLAGENFSNNNIKDINTNLANEILFNSKNNVKKSDDAISVKGISNSSKELVQLLQEVKTKLNMDPTEKVSDKSLANETLYKSFLVNANSTKVKPENTSDKMTSEELTKSIENMLSDKDRSEPSLKDAVSGLDKSIENMLSDKDISEPSLKDIISGLETLIANNMNLTSKEISNVKEKLESKISSLEDKLTVGIDSIDKLKSVLKGIDENLSTNKMKDINTNLANEILFNSKNNVNKSDDAISVKGSSNSSKELVQVLQEVKTNLNTNYSEKVLDNNVTNEKVSYKNSSEELVLKNLFKDSSEDSKISRAMNFIAHLNSAVETPKVPLEEKMVINKDTIVKDILKSVEYMETNNLKNLTVKINPKELGEVIIKVTMESGTMKASITAQNKEVFNLLNSNLTELNNKLESNNIRIESFTINIYEDTTFFMGQSGHENNGNNQKRKNSSSITKESKDDIEVLNNLNQQLNNINMFA